MELEVERKSDSDLSTDLLNRLIKFKGKNPLVMASSTESVDLARSLANKLDGNFEKVLVKKLVDPKDTNHIIGAVTEWGGVYLGAEAAARGYNVHNLQENILLLVEEMQRYRRQHPVVHSPEGELAIFVDVGSRTGYRLMAVLQSVKTYPPKLIVVATPKITHRAFALINNLCDEVIALKVT